MIHHPHFGLYDPIASLTHLFAAAAVLAASFFLHRKGRGDAARISSLLIFSASLFFLFSASGIYHALAPGDWRALFRRLDYAAIWIVIAGSATPVHTLLFRGHWRWGMPAVFWGAALTCLVLLEVYFTRLPYWAIMTGYIGLGSVGLVTFFNITARYGVKEAVLLLMGALAYAAGGLVDYFGGPVLIPGVFGAHELLHVLVMAGAVMHWLFIYNWADGQETTVNAAWAKVPVAVESLES
jgi:channel protein (hemolysin III family)